MNTTEQELRKTLQDLLQVVDMLMPGLVHIAVQDYALVNEAPIRARRLLALTKRGT